MASKAYMRLEGYKATGAGADLAHRGWITLDSVVIGNRPGSASGEPTRSRGETLDEDVVLVRELDSDTPQLAQVCAPGRVLKDIVIDMHGAVKGSSAPRTVRCRLTHAVVVRHRIRRQAKGKGKDSVGKEEILLRCAKTTFRQS